LPLDKDAEWFISELKKKTIYQGECWTYYYGLEKWNYARVTYKGKRIKLHRLIAHLYHGLDLDGPLLACHKQECEFRNCWNPNHIYIGTHEDNTRDQIEIGKFSSGWAVYQSSKTHCPKGHEYTFYGGRKRCKTCTLEWNKG
jgi:hypothetical protein